jgi:hypothetical protein
VTEFTDSFEWWENALKGVRGPIHDGEAKSGYYRSKNKDKSFSAWAFWRDSNTGEQRCQCDGRNVDEQRALEQFPYCSKNPISSEMFWHKIETGRWPDVDAAVTVVDAGPQIDPTTDPIGSMQAEIDNALAGVIAYQAIESDEQAARGQTLRSTLTTLSGKADKMRVAEKEPHLAASREVDAKYQPLVKMAKGGADDIRNALTAWENVKRDNARREQEAAEKVRREHEAAVAAAAKADEPPPPPPPVVASNTPAPSAQIRGGSGRAASVSTKPFVVSIDIDLAFKHFREDPAVRATLSALAQKAAEAGITVEGATVEQRAVVR